MIGLGWRSGTPLDAETQAEYEAAYSRPGSVAAMLGYYRAATRPRLAAAARRSRPAGRPRVKAEHMLVLWGAKDPVLPISTGESVVKDLGPECVMVTVPDAGHFVIEEAPDVVAEVLVDFLAEAGTVSRHVAPPEGPPHHRVAEAEPGSGDLLDTPSVGPVPVGATPQEQARADDGPERRPTRTARAATEKAPDERAPARKAAARKAPARKAPVKKAPATSSAKKAAARKAPADKAAGPATTASSAQEHGPPDHTQRAPGREAGRSGPGEAPFSAST
jgi:hypothetical protein